MAQYDFTLKFALGRQDADPEAYIGPLMREGCDDALIGIGAPGRIALDFSREASTAFQAAMSALADVKRAIPDARFLEATPDFVGVPDIATVLGVSRQYVGKLIKQYELEFPPPAHAGARAIWHLETVLTWMAEKRVRAVDPALLEVSRVNMRFNHAKEHGRVSGEISDTLIQAVG